MKHMNVQKYKSHANELAEQGDLLILKLMHELEIESEATKSWVVATTRAKVEERYPGVFTSCYEGWYSASRRLVKQVLPDRIEDFDLYYTGRPRGHQANGF